MCVRTYAGDPEGDRSVDASGLYQLGLILIVRADLPLGIHPVRPCPTLFLFLRNSQPPLVGV